MNGNYIQRCLEKQRSFSCFMKDNEDEEEEEEEECNEEEEYKEWL